MTGDTTVLRYSFGLAKVAVLEGTSSGSLRNAASAEPRPETASFQEHVIDEMTPGSEFKGGLPGKEHLAYQTVSGGKQYTTGGTRRALRSVVIDNRDGPEYNALNISPFGFTKDGDHYFYRVQGAKGDQDLVNADGHESRLYDLITGARIDVEAKTFSFVARDGSRFLRVTFDFH